VIKFRFPEIKSLYTVIKKIYIAVGLILCIIAALPLCIIRTGPVSDPVWLMKRHLINILILLIVLFLIPVKFYGNNRSLSASDEITKNNQIIIGAGWASLGIRDMGISPLYYSGSHLYGTAGYLKSNDTFLIAFNLNALYGTVHPDIYPDLTKAGMKSIKAGGGFSYMRFAGLFAGGEGRMFVGGTVDSKFGHYKHNKFTNSAINNYFLTSLGLSGQATYPLGRDQNNYLLVFNIHMPFVAAIVRDGYAYVKPSGFLNHNTGNFQSFFESIDFQSLNNFFSLESVLSFEYRLKNEIIWRFGYRWEYFGHKNSNVLKSATHGIFIQTLLNL
jgi:hypothetical protein